MMLHAPDAACPHRLDSMQGNGTIVHHQSSDLALVSKWQALLTEYSDVFEQLGSRLVDHHIDLVDPNAVPPKLWLYQMSEDELKALKDMIDNIQLVAELDLVLVAMAPQ